MALLLTAPQCFFIAILAFGVLGFYRGWRREVVSMAFSLAGVLFLYLGGGKSLAEFVFVRLPVILQVVSGGTSSTKPPPSPSDVNVQAAAQEERSRGDPCGRPGRLQFVRPGRLSALDSLNYSRENPCGSPGGFNSMVGKTLAVALEGTEVNR